MISKSCVFEKLSDGSLQFLPASSLSQHQQLYWWGSPWVTAWPHPHSCFLPETAVEYRQGCSLASLVSQRLRDTVLMPRVNSAISSHYNSMNIRNIFFRIYFYYVINIEYHNFIQYMVCLPSQRNFIELFSFTPFPHIVGSHPELLLYHLPSVKKQQSLVPSVRDVATETTAHWSSFLSLAVRQGSANW